MACHEKKAADHDGLSIADLLVRDPATQERTQVDESDVERVGLSRFIPAPTESLIRVLKVEGIHREHRVEAESLPQLGPEEHIQSLGMLSLGDCHGGIGLSNSSHASSFRPSECSRSLPNARLVLA